MKYVFRRYFLPKSDTLETYSNRSADVRYRHLADMGKCTAFGGKADMMGRHSHYDFPVLQFGKSSLAPRSALAK